MRAPMPAMMRTICLSSRFYCLRGLASAWFGPHGESFPRTADAVCATDAGSAAGAGKRKKNRRRARKEAEATEEKKIRTIPTHFVSLRITDEEVKRKADDLQQIIVEEFPRQKKNLIPLSRFHLTLLVCRLKSDEELQRARSALLEVRKSLLPYDEPFRISIAGVSSFKQGVLFAGVSEGCDSLLALANQTRQEFKDALLLEPDPDPRPPKMHLTLCKSSRGGIRMPKECLTRHVNEAAYFGSQEVRVLELCEMKSDPGTDYYRVHCELDLCSGEIRMAEAS